MSASAEASAALANTDRGREFRRYAAGVFLVALLVRLLHVWLLRRSPFFNALLGDARGYDEWAQRLAAGNWFGGEVFYQAPLYPYFLGVIYKVLGHSFLAVRLVQALVGAASCALLGMAGHRLFSIRVGVIAGGGLALYAPAIFFDALIQKSALDTFFLTLVLWLVSRLIDERGNLRLWLGLGSSMGCLSLTRENALVFVVLMVGWIIVGRQRTDRASTATTSASTDEPREANVAATRSASARRSRKLNRANQESTSAQPALLTQRLRAGAAFITGLAIVLLPVAVRNYAVGGGFYLTTSQFGPNFYIGNNPQADGTYASLRFGRGAPEYERTDATELAEHASGRRLTPAEVSSFWTDKALDFITGDPAAWLNLMARKTMLLFNATEMLDTEAQESHAEWSWPLEVGGIVGHFGVLVPLAVVGLFLCWKQRERIAVLYVMLVAYAASVLMFYVFARYRLPLAPMLLLFASAGVTLLPSWLRGANHIDRVRLLVPVALAAVFCNWPVLSKTMMRAITETNLATALGEQGDTVGAAEHYRRAIALQPDYAPAYNNLGVMQRASGNLEDAITTYRQALALKGDYPDAHYNLANALLAKNLPQEAADHFKIALQSIPDSAGAANNLGIALSAQNRTGDAVAAFRAAVAAEPNSAIAHRNLADALSSAGQVDEAVSEFQRAMALDPSDPSAHYNLGVVLLEAGRSAEAVGVLRQAVALAPSSVEARNNLGIALGSTGDLPGAAAQFRQALALDPNSVEARRNLTMAEEAMRTKGQP